jgi:hypothetical protein
VGDRASHSIDGDDYLRRVAVMREDPCVRTRISLAVGAVVLLHALSAGAAPKVFVRGFRGPQSGDIKAGVARAIRGAVDVVGSARGADAIVDGSVDKKGLSWVLSVTVRDGGGKGLGSRSYPMPAPRVDPSTAERLRRDIGSLAARGARGGGAAKAEKAERPEPEPKATKAKPPKEKPKKVARADDDKPRKAKGKRSASAADEADADERPAKAKGKRSASAADEADADERPAKGKRSAADEADAEKPRRETAAQRRAREKREKAEKAAAAKRDKAEKAAAAKRDKAEKERLAREGKRKGGGAGEPQVRGTVPRQADDDEATDVVGPKDKRADAKAAKARKEQVERERRERKVAEASEKLARAQAEAKRQRDEEQRRKAEAVAARRAEEETRREEAAAARRAGERRSQLEREEARRQKHAEDEERRTEVRRAREAERRSRDEEEERRTARRTKPRRGADDDDRRASRSAADDEEERDTGRRVARRAEAEEEADAKRRSSDDEGSARRRGEPDEKVSKPAPRPTPGRGSAILGAGVLLNTRHFEMSPKTGHFPVYDAAFYPAISLEGEIYPLGLAGVRPAKDLGLYLRYDRVIGLTSHENSATTGEPLSFNNQGQLVEGGILYRLHTGSSGLAPVVRPMASVGWQTFEVGANSNMRAVAYTYVALGLGFFVPIGHPNFGAVSTVRYHIIVGLGEIGGYGSAWTAWGVDVSVGLRLFIIRSLELAATYYYNRVEMTFQGVGPLSQSTGIGPSSGSDAYQGGRISLSYHF